MPHAELLTQLSNGSYDIVVLSSITREHREFEGIPISLVEALAAGVPCVATRTGALPELVDETCGILVAERDAAELVVAIKTLMNNPALRIRLSEGGRKRVLEAFDAQKTSSRMLNLMFAGLMPPGMTG